MEKRDLVDGYVYFSPNRLRAFKYQGWGLNFVSPNGDRLCLTDDELKELRGPFTDYDYIPVGWFDGYFDDDDDDCFRSQYDCTYDDDDDECDGMSDLERMLDTANTALDMIEYEDSLYEDPWENY